MRKITTEQRALIENAIEKGLPLKAKVRMDVKGGYRVSLDGEYSKIEAYLPRVLTQVGRYNAIKLFNPVIVRIKELSEERQSVVVSAMAYLKAHIYKLETDFIHDLRIGQEITARVKNITQFGAFVRLGALDGLLHNSKMPVPVKRGQEIKVRISHIDVFDHKISLEMDMPKKKYKIPKEFLQAEVHETLNLRTISAKKLREHLLALNLSVEEKKELEMTLRKRNDWGIRKVLKGSADWNTVLEGMVVV